MALFILAVIIFIIADILIRFFIKRVQERKTKVEREEVLQTSLKLDLSTKEAKSLKRAEVGNPKAKILCVDDEPIILDSFRKILVLDGYSVDTVENGREALNLIKTHHYDFLFTDLKMPEMDGVEVTNAVKHLRPDIDVIIITGYASIDTAVETMKIGAMDYVEKPFTEDELLDFTKKSLIKRQDRIRKQLKPQVHISHLSGSDHLKSGEFAIPGGVFISKDHCWVSIDQDGNAKIGIDDFANKLLGKIEKIDFPNLGMEIKKEQPLFSLKQGHRNITFASPVSGSVAKINSNLKEDIDSMEVTPYETNWICAIDANSLDDEIKELQIGKSAVSFYQEEIEKYQEKIKELLPKDDDSSESRLFEGEMSKLDDYNWEKMTDQFFKHKV